MDILVYIMSFRGDKMLVVLIRSIILYISVLIALRVMGKGEIAEMNSYDLVMKRKSNFFK